MIRNTKLQVIIAIALGILAAVFVWDYSRQMQAEVRAAQASAVQPPVVEQADVLIAIQDIPARTKVTGGLFKVVQVPREVKLPLAFSRVDEVVGMYTVYPLAAGEQVVPLRLASEKVLQSFVEAIPPGKRAIALSLSPLIGAGGLIMPGHYVDILVAYDKEAVGQNVVSTAMQDVEVLAVAASYAGEDPLAAAPSPVPNAVDGALTPTSGGSAPAPAAASVTKVPLLHPDAQTITLAVTPDQAEQILLAEQHGHLRLLLRGTGDTSITDVREVVLTSVPTVVVAATPTLVPEATVVPTPTTTPVALTVSALQVTDVHIGPPSLRPGDVLRVEITVRNVSDKIVKSEGPDPQYTYVQGQTYGTQDFPSIAGAYRVGLNFDGHPTVPYPYRWGLGADLPPGASTTVVGLVKVTYETKPMTFWAGVIREPGDIMVDAAGATLVTISATNTAVIAVDMANVRTGPDINAKIIWNLRYGVQVTVLGQQADWYRIRLTNGTEGWVAAGWIVAVPDANPPVANGAPKPPPAAASTNAGGSVQIASPAIAVPAAAQ